MEKEHHCLNSLKNIFRGIIYCNTKEIHKVNQNKQFKKNQIIILNKLLQIKKGVGL